MMMAAISSSFFAIGRIIIDVYLEPKSADKVFYFACVAFAISFLIKFPIDFARYPRHQTKRQTEHHPGA
jgi:uncharacterized membrane protein